MRYSIFSKQAAGNDAMMVLSYRVCELVNDKKCVSGTMEGWVVVKVKGSLVRHRARSAYFTLFVSFTPHPPSSYT